MGTMDERWKLARGKIRAAAWVGRALARTIADEAREGTLLETLRLSRRARTLAFADEPTFGELLERRAAARPQRPFLTFEGRTITTGTLNARANSLAAGLDRSGLRSGDNVALLSQNCPEFLEAFFAVQKLGLGAVPVNTALVGDGLTYVLRNSGARAAVVHRAQLRELLAVRSQVQNLETIVVITEGDESGIEAGQPTVEAWRKRFGAAENPRRSVDRDAVGLLLYTSGTTGAPKGVVYRYRDSSTKRMRLLANLLYDESDVLYTCLPLFHANALLLSTIQALNVGAKLALGRRFSARRFWSEAAESGATTFNALGAMIPILLKQPPGPADRSHRVRLVVSAACPAGAWRDFEERYGVRIVEAYAAVDGGGFLTINLGNAPVGSIGRPVGGAKYRLVREDGSEAPPDEPGELQVWTGKRERRVEYYRDADATSKKTRDGWLRTGDLLYRDQKGFLYFAGRRTDSMRRRGENVSAFEVESVLEKHPDILECAVFGVPSDLGEQDIMAVVVPIEGRRLDPAAVRGFLEGKLARFALPRYVEIVDELPKTGTHRVQKGILEKRGVTKSTWDAEAAESSASKGTARAGG